MSSNRPSIISSHPIINIDKDNFTLQKIKMILDVNNIPIDYADLFYEDKLTIDYSSDYRDGISPVKLKIKKLPESKLELSILLDYSRLNSNIDFFEYFKNHYNKILQSPISKKIKHLLPVEDNFIADITKQVQLIKRFNEEENTKTLLTLLNQIKKITEELQNNIKTARIFLTDQKNIPDEILNFLEEKNKQYETLKSKLKLHFSHIKNDSVITQSKDMLYENYLGSLFYDPKENIKKIAQDHITHDILTLLLERFIYDDHNIISDLYKYDSLLLINNIVRTLKTAKLLNDYNISQIYKICQSNTKEAVLKRFQFIDSMLPNIQKCELLTQEIVDMAFAGIQVDHSSQARLKGSGLEQLTATAAQQRWGYYCIIVEKQLMNMLKEKNSLSNLLQHAALMRHTIAKVEAGNDEFGMPRNNKTEDFYKADEKSVVDNTLFASIAAVINSNITLTNNTKTNSPSYFFLNPPKSSTEDYQYEWDKVSHRNVSLPKETLIIRTEQNNIKEVHCVFDAFTQQDTNFSINQLDRIYLTKLREKPLQANVDLLSELGELTFHLVKLYPYKRGTGAIIKWLTRSILQYHYGSELDVQLNDLRLGNDNNIPFDVYAHLVKTPQEYAKVFKANLEPLLHKVNAAISKNM